jgi:hypothetical protein
MDPLRSESTLSALSEDESCGAGTEMLSLPDDFFAASNRELIPRNSVPF